MPSLSVVTLVNDDEQYAVMRASLSAQAPGELEWLAQRPDETGLGATESLNIGLADAGGDWILCVHQDVIFPSGWWRTAVRQLEGRPDRVAVAGTVGVTSGGRFRGHILDAHGHACWGPLPSRVASLDEHLLIIRRESELRFDPHTPGFHCYGADIALSARYAGLDAVALDAPVVHLSPGRLDDSFDRAARWLAEKWGPANGGVIPTTAAVIRGERHSPLRLARVRLARRRSLRASKCTRGLR